VLVELDGLRLLTDPVLGRRVAHLWRHSAPPSPFDKVDAVLISHAHHDHLDVRSLRRLGTDTRILAPAGSATVLRKKGFTQVEEVAAGEMVELPPLRVRVLPARHRTKRIPLGSESPAVAFRVDGTASVIFFGDTELFDQMRDFGPVDVALLPVWGWGPSIGPGHMNPERAARAAALLQARVAIPVHWGSFRPLYGALRRSFLDWPGPEFARHASKLAPGVAVRVLAPGETTEVGMHPR